MSLAFDRTAAFDGVKAIAPLMVPAGPFGLALGLIIQSGEAPRAAAWASSWLIFAGSSQLAAINLVGGGASALVVIVTVALINARHFMYSAALRSHFAEYPQWVRLAAPYFLTDQAFAIASTTPGLVESGSRYKIWHFVGAGIFMWSLWQSTILLGLVVGSAIPTSWQLDFAAPILFLGLMVLSISNRPGVVSAVVGAVIAVATRSFPNGTGMLLAIVLGMAAGAVADERQGSDA